LINFSANAQIDFLRYSRIFWFLSLCIIHEKNFEIIKCAGTWLPMGVVKSNNFVTE